MDTQRLILFFVFVFSTFMLVEGWQRDQKQHSPAVQAGAGGAKADGKTAGGIPVPAAPTSQPAVTAAPGAVPTAVVAGGGEIIRIETDVLSAQISTKGGDIRRLEFKQHRGTLDKTKNFVLFQSNADNTYIAQSGLIGPEGLPNHHTVYS